MTLTTTTTADWRATLRRNQRRTYAVILLFFMIYGAIGIVVDMTRYASIYPTASPSQLLQGLLTLHLFPLATLILLGIAGLSLFVSYSLHDKLMLLGTDYHEIKPDHAHSLEEQQLYHVIEEMKIAAGLRFMPRVFIIEADYMNAFASGYSEKSAMVAITRGLMQKLNRDELQAVMAHELSHIRHLDIKLTLTASLLANMTLIVIDLLFQQAIFNSRREGRSRDSLMSIIMLLRFLLPIISVLLLLYLSRTREYMADAGAVELMRTPSPLAQALMKINQDYQQHHDTYNMVYNHTPNENVRREAYIFDPTQAGLHGPFSISDFFSTHPTLSNRLKALGFKLS
jgi:heat shock protein HtpX